LSAQPADASAVEALLDAAAAWLQSRSIDQWKPGRFGEEVRQTIATGELFVTRRGTALVGCFMLEAEEPPSVIRWLVEQRGIPTRGAFLARLVDDR
jgi:hypothetical protein